MVNHDWLKELKDCFGDVQFLQEGGYSYIYIPELSLPKNCTPFKVEALLCIQPRDGYDSRLYVSTIPKNMPARNWNGNIYILDKNWRAISWRSAPGLTYLEMLLVHLKPFKQ